MRIKSDIKKIISSLFFPFYRFREIFVNNASVRVLAYHSIGNHLNTDVLGLTVNEDDFRNQMQNLKDWGYEVIDIDTIFTDAIFLDKIGKKFVVLTFDDGYKDFITHVLPILEEFHYPAIVFVTVEYLQGFRKENTADYWLSWDKMSWHELKKIKINNQIKIGSHGYSHKQLNQLNHDKILKEITFSKEILENELGDKVEFFAYPYGVYNKACLFALKESGYKAAFTGKPGLFTTSSNLYEIKRTEISYYHSSRLEFYKKLNGSYDWLALTNLLLNKIL